MANVAMNPALEPACLPRTVYVCAPSSCNFLNEKKVLKKPEDCPIHCIRIRRRVAPDRTEFQGRNTQLMNGAKLWRARSYGANRKGRGCCRTTCTSSPFRPRSTACIAASRRRTGVARAARATRARISPATNSFWRASNRCLTSCRTGAILTTARPIARRRRRSGCLPVPADRRATTPFSIARKNVETTRPPRPRKRGPEPRGERS